MAVLELTKKSAKEFARAEPELESDNAGPTGRVIVEYEQFRAAQVIVLLWLLENSLSDDGEPLTDGWMEKALTGVIIERDSCLRGFHPDCGDLRLDVSWITQNKTRGDFRQLCRALGMTLKD